jgi:hypothetical protein
MPRPNTAGVHIDGLLSNLSIAYMQAQDVFIFPKVFKPVPVDNQSDLYTVFDKDDFNLDEAQVRKDSTESAGSGYDLSEDNYKCEVYGFHKDVGDQILANAGKTFNLMRDSTEFVTRKILLKQERKWVEKYLVSGAWDETLVGITDFDQISEPTSAPIEMFSNEMVTMLEATGIEPNTLVMGYKVFNDLKNHPDFVDRVKYSSSDAVTEGIMARLIGVERILVAKSIVATGKGATKTTAFNFGRNALLCYAAPSPGLLTPSAGYTFSWNYAGVGNIAINKFYIREKKTTRVEAESAFDCKVTAKSLGKLFTLVTEA